MEGQVSLFGPDLECGKTCQVVSPRAGTRKRGKRGRGAISGRSFGHSSRLKNHTLMLLDLREGAGNMLGPCWEYDPPWLGSLGTLNTSECPRDVVESFLSQILLAIAPLKYYLSKKACKGILRRSRERGKPLPRLLETALRLQAGLVRPTLAVLAELGLITEPGCLNPWDTQQARVFTPESKAPTLASADGGGGRNPAGLLLAAGFCAGAAPTAGGIGYQEECSPTLKASESGTNMVPSVLCLNDQGGKAMHCTENISGTLRAQEHGHQPLVFENHGVDARYTGPHRVSPTLSCRAGTGGNNLPLTLQSQIEVYSRQRSDKFKSDDVASTESARQDKDPADLVCQIKKLPLLIRRFLPVEAERLQGYPDNWTALPKASDSARYRALGNSVAIPCVEHLISKIAQVLRFSEDNTNIPSHGR